MKVDCSTEGMMSVARRKVDSSKGGTRWGGTVSCYSTAMRKVDGVTMASVKQKKQL